MTSYRIKCDELDPELAEERFPSIAEAKAVAEFVSDGEPFQDYELVLVAAEPTMRASDYIPNRNRLLLAIETHGSEALKAEIAYITEVWDNDPECQEQGFDEAEVFSHVSDVAEWNKERSLVRDCNKVLVECGYLQPRKPGTKICGRDRATIINGVRHDVAAAWCSWIEQ